MSSNNVIEYQNGAWSSLEHATVRFSNFATLPQATGDSVRSPSFECCGRWWYLALYPRGKTVDGTVGVYLRQDWYSNQSPVHIRLSLGAQTADQNRASDMIYCLFQKNSSAGSSYGGGRRDILENGLDDEGHLDVKVSMRCFLRTEETIVPGSSMLVDFEGLLKRPDLSDVTFALDDGKTAKAHSFVLKVRSTFFQDLLSGDWQGPIPIHGIDKYTFMLLLHYLYSEKRFMIPDPEKALDVAKRFSCERLQTDAERKLAETLHVDNCMELMFYANSNGYPLLLRKAKAMVAHHADRLRDRDGWNEIAKHKELAADLWASAWKYNRKPRKKQSKRKPWKELTRKEKWGRRFAGLARTVFMIDDDDDDLY